MDTTKQPQPTTILQQTHYKTCQQSTHTVANFNDAELSYLSSKMQHIAVIPGQLYTNELASRMN
jgi:hypothetical protein